LVIVSWLLSIPAQSLELGGYYENDPLAVFRSTGGSPIIGDLNRFRLKIDQKFDPYWSFHIEPRYYYLAKSENIPLAGVTDIDKVAWDRYYAKFRSPLIALTVGKQRIAWGSGYIWNPTDIFNPFVLSFAVKEEEESNVEALRVEVPIGERGGLDGYLLNDKKGIKVKGNAGKFDLSASFVDMGNGTSQIGFDSVGEVWGVGMRSEAAVKNNNIMQAVLGWDYTLDNGVGLNMEYLYNGAGKKNKNDYDWAGLAAGNIKQVGMDYLFFSANKQIDEITGIRASMLSNLDDSSWLFYPSYTRNISQNVDLSLESMLTFGSDGSEYKPGLSIDPTGFSGSMLGLVRLIWGF